MDESSALMGIAVGVGALGCAVGLLGAAVALVAARRGGGGVDTSRDARSDYEYEARKRLYAAAGPHAAQLMARSDQTMARVRKLAAAVAAGELTEDGKGALAGDGPLLRACLYDLTAPLAAARLMAHQLAEVDVTVDPWFGDLLRVLQVLEGSLGADLDIAAIPPRISYEPDHPNARFLQTSEPRTYRRQGLPPQFLDQVIGALLVPAGDGRSRLRSEGEFDQAYADESTGVKLAMRGLAHLLTGFHPSGRPVLWRILILQIHLLNSVAQLGDDASKRGERFLVETFPNAERRRYAVRGGDSDAAFAAVHAYLKQQLGDGYGKSRGAAEA